MTYHIPKHNAGPSSAHLAFIDVKICRQLTERRRGERDDNILRVSCCRLLITPLSLRSREGRGGEKMKSAWEQISLGVKRDAAGKLEIFTDQLMNSPQGFAFWLCDHCTKIIMYDLILWISPYLPSVNCPHIFTFMNA